MTLDGDGLVLEANAEPPQAVLDALARHTHDVLARPGQDGWTAEDWHAYFDERIEIAMSNGLPRAESAAERSRVAAAESASRIWESEVTDSGGGCVTDVGCDRVGGT